MARKLTKSREITSTTSEISPDPGPRFLLLLFSISAVAKEIAKRNEEKQVLPKSGTWEPDMERKQKKAWRMIKKRTKIKKTCYFIFIFF